MKPKVVFFGSDRYSEIVRSAIAKDKRFELAKKGELGIIASYSQIIPAKTIAGFKHGILNIHPSLLPQYRGPSPVQKAILESEKETGVTIIKIDDKADHGPILAQSKKTILNDDTAGSLYQRLFQAGAELLLKILPDYLDAKIKLQPQDHRQATYTKKLNRDDGQINWQKPADYNERFIRAMSPWPGAWALLHPSGFAGQAKRLKILKAHLKNKKLILDLVQLEGKKPVTWKQFLEGYPQASFA